MSFYKKVQKIIEEWQKTEFSWRLIAEYELTEKSDDECHVQKAEKAAEKKLNTKRKHFDSQGSSSNQAVTNRNKSVVVVPATQSTRWGYNPVTPAQYQVPHI